MILKNDEVEICNSVGTRLKTILGTTYSMQRFHSEAFNRDCNVFVLESQNSSVVLKKTNDINEVHSYRLLSKMKDKNIPNIYFIEKDNQSHWIAMEHLKVHGDGWTKENIEDLVIRLAKIHTWLMKEDELVEGFRKWKHKSKDALNELMDSDIREEHIEVILKSYEILMNSHQTFVHGDMIPLNMIVTEEGVRIIDWEYGHVGPYIQDIGRLLGDYNVDRPWVNSDWETDLLKLYYQTLLEGDLDLTYDQMFLAYQCARLENYFDIVSSFKIRKWKRTEWYDLNLKEMMNSIKVISQLLKD